MALAGWSGPRRRAATTVGTIAAALALTTVLPASAANPSSSPTATPYAGTPAVGALFALSKGRLRHFCTAAMVRSPAGDLGITAAHCLQGRRLGRSSVVYFAPGYHAGRFPFGRWRVTSALTDRSWRRTQDPDDDVAFFLITRGIEKVTGAELLVTGTRLPQRVTVTGYPDARRRPVTCRAPARALARKGLAQLVFDCGGFTAGTSGSPFLTRVRKATGTGQIIGVIGGYQQGGDSPQVSYSARFGHTIAVLYRRARSAAS
jgi:V8-like Glu-specific endopeptidase